MQESLGSISPLATSLLNSLSTYLPAVLGAVSILVIGYFVALIASAVTRKGLHKLGLNRRISTDPDSPIDFEGLIARIVYWFIVLFALIGLFDSLHIEAVSGPLSNLASTVTSYLPRLFSAGALAGAAWLIATLVRTVIGKALGATTVDEKLSESAGVRPLADVIGNVGYWLVFLLFLPTIVGALQIEGLIQPLASMTTDLIGILPNALGAGLIGLIGWVLAKAVRGLVTNLLTATGIDKAAEETGSELKLAPLLGTIVFVLIIVPTLIAALDKLHIDAISKPLTETLNTFLAAVPHLIAAAAILGLAWYLGRFVADLVGRLLQSLGFDLVPERLGLAHAFEPRVPGDEPLTLSGLVSKVVLFYVLLLATTEAANRLGFTGVQSLVATFIDFGGNILLGLAIFAIGYWLANLASETIARASKEGGTSLARIVRYAILGLVLALGLRAFGIADEIVNLAFGLVLGSVAVAVALAFGLGGREAAGRLANSWVSKHLDK